jgi:peroxiredoxin Q/BCP
MAIVGFLRRQGGSMPLLKTGDRAPDFSAQAHTGQQVKLGDHRGKHVVLWFYPKADTPG